METPLKGSERAQKRRLRRGGRELEVSAYSECSCGWFSPFLGLTVRPAHPGERSPTCRCRLTQSSKEKDVCAGGLFQWVQSPSNKCICVLFLPFGSFKV